MLDAAENQIPQQDNHSPKGRGHIDIDYLNHAVPSPKETMNKCDLIKVASLNIPFCFWKLDPSLGTLHFGLQNFKF